MPRELWAVVVIATCIAAAGCTGESSGNGAGNGATAEAAGARAADAVADAELRDACELIRAEEVAAIVGQSVSARPEAAGAGKASCMYEASEGGRTWFGITVTWRGGREMWDIMQSGTALAIDVMGTEFAGEDVNVDSIVRPGAVAGLGDAAVFSDIMPSAILKDDTLIEMLMTFLPEPKRHFVPLGRKAVERL